MLPPHQMRLSSARCLARWRRMADRRGASSAAQSRWDRTASRLILCGAGQAKTVEVRGQNPLAGCVPSGAVRSRLSQQRPERDDVARGDRGHDRGVSTAAIDEALNDAVDLVANGDGGRIGDRWATMEGQDELIPHRHCGFDEPTQSVAAGCRRGLGRPRVRQHQLKGPVREVVQQLLAGCEVPVQRSDTQTCIRSDRRHPHADALAVNRSRRRPYERLTVADSVAAPLTRTVLCRTPHKFI